MYYSTHLLVGATVGAATGHPVKAFLAGLASHILLDIIPHHDHNDVKLCVLDVCGSTLLFAIWYFYYQPGMNVLVGAIAAVVPDIEIPLFHFKLINRRYFPSHSGWTPHATFKYPGGVIIQLVIMGLAIWSIS